MTTHKTLRGPRGGLILTTKDWIKKLNSAVFPGDQGGPFMHAIAAKAIALREASEPAFRTYAAQVVENAGTLARVLGERGLRIVSGGTDNHLMLVDVSTVGLTGADAEDALGRVGVTCNKNLIPYDEQPPMKASGVRIGTAAVTTRGLGVAEMERLGGIIADVLGSPGDETVQAAARSSVAELTAAFPIPSGRAGRPGSPAGASAG